MGGGKSKPGVLIQTEKPFYLPGDIVQGWIYINSPYVYPARKIILSIDGNEEIWWKGGLNGAESLNNNQIGSGPQGRRVPIVEGDRFGKSKIVQASFVLKEFGNQNFQGQHAFPFEFQLPSFVPGSYRDEKSEYKALIVYEIKCDLISGNKNCQDVSVIQELIVREPQRHKEHSLYGETFLYPETCLCVKNGVAKVCCYFEKNQYIAGDECVAICEIDNLRNKLRISSVSVKFKKILTLTSGFGENISLMKDINEAAFPGVDAFGKYTGSEAQKVMVPLKYNDSKMLIHPSTNGKLVKCRYILEVTSNLPGCCLKGNSSFEVPLNIVQEGIPVPEIEQPTGWNPEIYARSSIHLNQNMENERLNQMGNNKYFY